MRKPTISQSKNKVIWDYESYSTEDTRDILDGTPSIIGYRSISGISSVIKGNAESFQGIQFE
jgi:hypothetical protein